MIDWELMVSSLTAISVWVSTLILLVMEVLVTLLEGIDDEMTRMISIMLRLCDREEIYGEIGILEVRCDGALIG